MNNCQPNCGCKFEVDSSCVRYTAVNLGTTLINVGDTIETTIIKIDQAITNLQQTINNNQPQQFSGPLNKVVKFGPPSNPLLPSQTEDDGDSIGINASPNASTKVLIETSQNQSGLKVSSLNNGKEAIIAENQSQGSVINKSLVSFASGSTTSNIGIETSSTGTSNTNIGLSSTALGATNNYSAQLKDGTQTVNGGKFLKDKGDGKANWANITAADVSGVQGSLTLTTTGTSGAATLVGNTLNIPQYSGGGSSNLNGTVNGVAIFNTTNTITTYPTISRLNNSSGDSLVIDNLQGPSLHKIYHRIGAQGYQQSANGVANILLESYSASGPIISVSKVGGQYTSQGSQQSGPDYIANENLFLFYVNNRRLIEVYSTQDQTAGSGQETIFRASIKDAPIGSSASTPIALSILDSGQVKIGPSGGYILPLLDGSYGQVPVTNGNGIVSWETIPTATEGRGFSPVPISLCTSVTTQDITETTQYYYQTMAEQTMTISKMIIHGHSGFELVQVGIYLGTLQSGILIGKGTLYCGAGSNQINITSVSGNSLTVQKGQDLVVALYSEGYSFTFAYATGISDTSYARVNPNSILQFPSTPSLGQPTPIRFACTLC